MSKLSCRTRRVRSHRVQRKRCVGSFAGVDMLLVLMSMSVVCRGCAPPRTTFTHNAAQSSRDTPATGQNNHTTDPACAPAALPCQQQQQQAPAAGRGQGKGKERRRAPSLNRCPLPCPLRYAPSTGAVAPASLQAVPLSHPVPVSDPGAECCQFVVRRYDCDDCCFINVSSLNRSQEVSF